MRSIVIRNPGGPEVLEELDRPLPEPGLGQIRIRVPVGRELSARQPSCARPARPSHTRWSHGGSPRRAGPGHDSQRTTPHSGDCSALATARGENLARSRIFRACASDVRVTPPSSCCRARFLILGRSRGASAHGVGFELWKDRAEVGLKRHALGRARLILTSPPTGSAINAAAPPTGGRQSSARYCR
jgi:hypothetical protein